MSTGSFVELPPMDSILLNSGNMVGSGDELALYVIPCTMPSIPAIVMIHSILEAPVASADLTGHFVSTT